MKKIIFLLLAAVFLAANIAMAAVNINTADPATLTSLPGIGEKKAAAIVAYRQAHGDFKKAEDLIQVKGIGPKIFEKLSKEVTVK